MSLMSHGARGLAKAFTAALVIAGAAVAPAQAASVPDVTLEYTCKYPIVDKQPLSITVSSNIPRTAPERVNQPPFQITATAVAKGDTARAINTLNAYTIEGSSDAFADLEFADGFIQQDLLVPLVVEPWTRPSSDPVTGDLTLIAKGNTPSIQLEPVGDSFIRLDRITLTLSAKGQSGNIINVRKLTTDFDGNPVVPADSTPNDFNVYCKLNPGQSNLIATIQVVSCSCFPNEPPSKVTGLKSPTQAVNSVDLAWDAATDPDAGDSVKEYRVYDDGTLVKTVAAPATSVTVDGLAEQTDYEFSVEAVDTRGLAGPRSDALRVRTRLHGDCFVDTRAPTTPTAGLYLPDGSDIGLTTLNVRWGASFDPADELCPVSGVDYYVVATEGEADVRVPAGTLNKLFTGLRQDWEYRFSITAVDKAGNASKASEELLVTRIENQPLSVPTALKAGSVTSSSLALSWLPSTDDAKVAGYNVYRDGVKIGTSPTPTFSVTGLAPETRYTFEIEAFDEDGAVSPKSAGLVVTTLRMTPGPLCPEGFACQGYALAGSTTLKTLTTGVLPLKGGIDAQLDPSNGKFTADLVLNPTTGRLTAGGFLPITVKIGFAPSGKTTGTLDDNNILRSKSLVRIKVSEVKLFGAIPLAGGNSCQTKSLSEINLTSTKAFEIFKGGTLTGTYAISDLNGCGVLNGIVSPLTAGKGNTISLNLTPKA